MASIYELLPQCVAPGSAPIIIEIGAHEGQDTARMLRMFPKAVMHVFEPDPRNVFKLIKAEIYAAVNFVPAAVGDRDGVAIFHLSSGLPPTAPQAMHDAKVQWSCSSSLRPPAASMASVFPWMKFEHRVIVPCVRLDTYAKTLHLPVVDFVWADVQGAEDLVIAGAQETLGRTRYFYTEFSNTELYQGQRTLEQLLAMLPGAWDIAHQFESDVLLRNRDVMSRAA